MKRFIIISLLAMTMGKAFGCSGPYTHNYYLYKVTGNQDFGSRVQEICRQNWITYGNGVVTYGYNTDEFIEAARKKNDPLMVSYVQQLQKYLKCCDEIKYSWDYPTKEQIAERNRTLTAVRSYAQSKLQTRLRSQHALLLMRCNMLMNRHQENITFWEQTASKYIDTVYKEMMENIYAGALVKVGRKSDGARIFAAQNDQQSLYTIYFKSRSAAAISQEYQRDPNSPVLPFLLQDFVNNTQEAYDAQKEEGFGGKLFIRDISKAEALQMCSLAQQAARNSKVENPSFWHSAEAMLQYFFGNRNTALRLAKEAVDMPGTEIMKDNARVIRLYLQSDLTKADQQLDNFLAEELTWLEGKMQAEEAQDGNGGEFFHHAFDRLINMVLAKKYQQRGEMGTAFLAAYCAEDSKYQTSGFPSGLNQDHSSEFFCRIDTISAQQLKDFANYLNAPQSRLDQWLSRHAKIDQAYLNDLLATKCLRTGQWQEAINHLNKVPLAYIQEQLIVPYMAVRSYKALPWADQKDPEWEDTPSKFRITKSQKLDYAQEMLSLENGFSALNGEQQKQRAFDLAVRYYQSSVYGDAWYLTRYGKSCFDKLRSDEMDRIDKAVKMLNIAKQSTNFQLKEKALYALAYLPGDEWITEEWNDNTSRFETRLHRNSRQYHALNELLTFKQKNAARVSAYVSRCDVLKQFQKQH